MLQFIKNLFATKQIKPSGLSKREAILAAADHIEANPNVYEYMQGEIPNSEEKRGCALAWVGHFLGMRSELDSGGEYIGHSQAAEAIGLQTWEAYDIIKDGAGGPWEFNPSLAAKGLRHLAQRY